MKIFVDKNYKIVQFSSVKKYSNRVKINELFLRDLSLILTLAS